MVGISLGLKLWSSNVAWIPQARRLIDGGDVQYVEIMPVSGPEDVEPFLKLPCPIVIHANTDRRNINIADRTHSKDNRSLMQNEL